MSEIEVRLCTDCRFYKKPNGNRMCCHTESASTDHVDGSLDYYRCAWMRDDKRPCGPEGKLFEERAATVEVREMVGGWITKAMEVET